MYPIVPPVGEIFDVSERVPFKVELRPSDGVYSMWSVTGNGFVWVDFMFSDVSRFAEFGCLRNVYTSGGNRVRYRVW